jgi:hypothetical protein
VKALRGQRGFPGTAGLAQPVRDRREAKKRAASLAS